MTERDDDLLKHFFEEHKQELTDNGFSAHVMKKLPRSPIQTYNRLWTFFCCMVGLAFILFTRGWELAIQVARNAGVLFFDALLGVNLSGFTPLVLFGGMLTIIGVTIYNLSLLKD